LRNANLSNTVLSNARLGGADLRDANLSGAHLHDAVPSGAHLSSANLHYSYLQHAHLKDAHLDGADLSYAKLGEADLSGANLDLADLSNAEGVDAGELEHATNSLAGTTMPDGTVRAGRYATREFDPALSFKVSDHWERPHPEVTDQLLIWTGPEGGQLRFISPQNVFDKSDPSKQREAPENAKEWVSWFQSHPNLDASNLGPASVGGAPGAQIDVTYASRPENYPLADPCGGEPSCVPLFPTSGVYGGIASFASDKDRFVIVDVEDEPVVIDINAQAGKFDDFLPKAQKVLDKVEWENSGPS
jgi:hypothetical protein